MNDFACIALQNDVQTFSILHTRYLCLKLLLFSAAIKAKVSWVKTRVLDAHGGKEQGPIDKLYISIADRSIIDQ